MTFDAATMEMLGKGLLESLYMIGLSSAISYLIGIPLGIILVVTDKDGIRPMPALQTVLGIAINLLRAVPFIILLIMVLPITELIVGTVVGSKAIIPPLVIAAAPYIAPRTECLHGAASGRTALPAGGGGHLHHDPPGLLRHCRLCGRRRTGGHRHQLRVLSL